MLAMPYGVDRTVQPGEGAGARGRHPPSSLGVCRLSGHVPTCSLPCIYAGPMWSDPRPLDLGSLGAVLILGVNVGAILEEKEDVPEGGCSRETVASAWLCLPSLPTSQGFPLGN